MVSVPLTLQAVSSESAGQALAHSDAADSCIPGTVLPHSLRMRGCVVVTIMLCAAQRQYYCYLLTCDVPSRRRGVVYIGYTAVSPAVRLHAHNQGRGSKKTRKYTGWRLVTEVHGFTDLIAAVKVVRHMQTGSADSTTMTLICWAHSVRNSADALMDLACVCSV